MTEEFFFFYSKIQNEEKNSKTERTLIQKAFTTAVFWFCGEMKDTETTCSMLTETKVGNNS